MEYCEGVCAVIRLIATDLDDTLLDAGSDITPRTQAALNAAMAAGCGVALNSGRMLEATLPFAERIGANAPMLLYNGAWIYDHRAGETIRAQRVPFETALGIARLLEAMGFYFQIYPGTGYLCSEIRDQTRRYAASVRVAPAAVGMPLSRWLEANPADLFKLLLIDTPEGADRAQAALREAFPAGASYLKSRPNYLEIAPEGVDKGRSLAALGAHLKLSRREIMAFGDGQNDAPMLEYAGIGCAVANACPQALAAADMVAPPNTEDGVAQMIEQFLREGRIGPMRR